jgi:hypothetical protein
MRRILYNSYTCHLGGDNIPDEVYDSFMMQSESVRSVTYE